MKRFNARSVPRSALGIIIVLAATLAGCAAKGPPPNMYLLSSEAPSRLPTFETGVVVGLGPVAVAPYLNRNQIVTRTTASRLDLSEGHQWAEPLKDGLTRVLLVNLGVALNSNRVYALPLLKRQNLDYEVVVDILRFDGDLTREAILGARWSILEGKSQTPFETRVSVIHQPISGQGYEAFVAAQSEATAKLGRDIADAILKRIDKKHAKTP
jgi:uncharacterized lipoprotein YmbA